MPAIKLNVRGKLCRSCVSQHKKLGAETVICNDTKNTARCAICGGRYAGPEVRYYSKKIAAQIQTQIEQEKQARLERDARNQELDKEFQIIQFLMEGKTGSLFPSRQRKRET